LFSDITSKFNIEEIQKSQVLWRRDLSYMKEYHLMAFI